MDRCQNAHVWMTRDADGVLDARDRALLDDHTAGCESCRQARAAQVAVAAVLRGRPPIDAPPAFTARVLAAVAEPPSWFGLAEWRTWTWRLVPVAAALFVIAAFVDGRTDRTSAPATATSTPARTAAASTDTRPESVLWDADATQDQVLLTVLTGRRQAASEETRHE